MQFVFVVYSIRFLVLGIDNVTSDAPCLAVCFANGLVQTFQHERDEGYFKFCWFES